MTRHKQSLLILVLIVSFGTILRFSFPKLLPPSPNWDEVSIGYNAYSLLHSGQDEWGVKLPTIFRAYGDYKLPGYIYSSVLPIRLFGLNTFSTRLPSLLSGVLLIIVTYILAIRLFHRQSLALLSALLMSIEPWGLFLSRIAVEANLCLLFVTLGLTLLISKKYFLSAVFLGLSVWTYNSARIFVPVFLFGYYFQNLKLLRSSPATLLTLLIFIIPMLIQLISPIGQARFNWVNLLDSGAILRIESARLSSSLPDPLPRLIFNRPVYFGISFTRNYLSHFLPNFLFIQGGSQYQFNIPHYGLLSLINLPLFMIGLLTLSKYPKSSRNFLLLWLLLAPVASSATRDSPHTLRALVMLPPLLITAAAGLVPRFKFVYLAILLSSLTYYIFFLVPSYIPTYSWSWQYGYSQVIQYLKSNFDLYDEIIFTKKYGEPHEYVLFNWPWNSSAYNTDNNLVRYFKSDWYWVDSFSKFKFVNDWEMPEYVSGLPTNKKFLIISSPDNITAGNTVSMINFLNNQPAFIIKTL